MLPFTQTTADVVKEALCDTIWTGSLTFADRRHDSQYRQASSRRGGMGGGGS